MTPARMSFPDSVLDALAARPQYPAVEDGGRVVTRGELLTMIGADDQDPLRQACNAKRIER